jgi:hypothetical protein
MTDYVPVFVASVCRFVPGCKAGTDKGTTALGQTVYINSGRASDFL